MHSKIDQTMSPPSIPSRQRIPRFLSTFNELTRRMLELGIRIGPFALMTVRGRTTGLLRTTPVSVVEAEGRRWVQATTGETNWAKNLRASGEATLTAGRRTEVVRAIELSHEEVAAFYRDVLGPKIRRVPFGTWLIGSQLQARDVLDDPHEAAAAHPVFELIPMSAAGVVLEDCSNGS